MFIQRLRLFFFLLTIFASLFLIYTWYENHQFKNNPLNENIINQIKQKELELQRLAFIKYGVKRKIPIKISNKMPSRLFGATTTDKRGNIVIFLNKKRFQESVSYMIDDVLPHEYAHALMFVFKDFSDENGGHSLRWENICKNLNGLRCNRFVNNHDVISNKINPF